MLSSKMIEKKRTILQQTKRFAYIAQKAQASEFSQKMNKLFDENGYSNTMIPMNSEKENLSFKVNSIRKSDIDAAIISSEYVSDIVTILDSASGMVQRSGMCDIIFKEGEKLRGDIFSVRVLTEHLKDLYASKIAMIGVNHYAKAFSFLACGFHLTLFNDELDTLIRFTKEVELQKAEIHEIQQDIKLDFSEFDVVLDFSNMKSFAMVEKLAKINIDMKNKNQLSALKNRALELHAKYVSYDDLLEKLTQKAYREIRK